ncbi:hypothetical protein KR51_00022950 [Rubidibacter lacunae KORDI 51-2]|uniref:Uncharacterized protein n=2 Tax=Rubidibacter TaxID=582491 RepID=U5D8W6_9CHRO|nr:hypothetical protein KR51_00022950 [Rubidibacter lacunae KORDI 51-2]
MAYSWENEGQNLEANSAELSEPLTLSIEEGVERLGSSEISQFEAGELIVNAEIAEYLNTLPPTHLENICTIKYEPKPKSESSAEIKGTIKLRLPGIEGWVSAKSSPEQSVESFRENLTYEVGLKVYFDVLVTRLELEAKWSDIHHRSLEQFVKGGFGLISERSLQGKAEDFAETYTVYRLDSDKLLACSNEKYEFMREEIFYGREYHS